MHLALLNDAFCREMNGKGFVSDGKRNVGCYEKDEKVGKNRVQKTHNGNNLEKLNDAKCTILCRRFTQKPFEE